MSLDREFAFIIGAPRSGTTWLQAMMGAHPELCTTGELKLFDFFTGPWAEAWRTLEALDETDPSRKHGLTMYWSRPQFYAFMREFLDRVYAIVVQQNPRARLILDKTPAYANHVDHILELLPQARFIHLIRDGRDVAASMNAASRGWARLWAPAEVGKAAALWKSFVLSARKAARHEGRYLEVRYEELLARGAAVLQTVFAFVGLPIDGAQAARIVESYRFDKMKAEGSAGRVGRLPEGFLREGRAGSWRDGFSPMDRYVFNEVAGDLLCALGYAEPGWWSESAYERLSTPVKAVLADRRRRSATVRRVAKTLLRPLFPGRSGVEPAHPGQVVQGR